MTYVVLDIWPVVLCLLCLRASSIHRILVHRVLVLELQPSGLWQSDGAVDNGRQETGRQPAFSVP